MLIMWSTDQDIAIIGYETGRFMIPTTITGFVIVLLLLLPGFVFVTFRERHQPSRKLSVLRETSTVFAATTVAYVAPALIAVVTSVFWPDLRGTFASLLSSPEKYGAEHPFRLLALIAAFVLLASAASYFLGTKMMTKFVPGAGGSAWWLLFEQEAPKGTVSIQASATLQDDTVVTGTLHSWSRDAADHQDRDMVLRSPIWIQAPKARKPYELDSQALSVSAREIRFLSVRYFA